MAKENIFAGTISLTTRESMDSRVARYLELQAEKKKIETEMKELSSSLIEEMEGLGVEPSQSLQLEDHKCKYVNSTRQTWDTKKLVALLDDKADEYRSSTTYQRLYIS